MVTCGACHQADGKGLANMAPALAKSDWVLGDTHRVIGVAVHGLMGPIKVNGEPVVGVPPIMPPHGFMKDEQLADILTYVRNAWGNQADGISGKKLSTTARRNPPAWHLGRKRSFEFGLKESAEWSVNLYLFDYHNATHNGVVSGKGTQELV